MKKTILSIILTLFIASLYSQELSTTKSNFKGGARLGFTASQISGDDLSGFHKLGAYGGGFVNFPLTKTGNWKIQVELNFIMKGSSMFVKGVNNPNQGRKYTLNLFYTETPVLVKYLIKGFEIEVGPAFNIKLFERERDEQGDLHRKPFRPFELAIVIGAGYLFKEHWGINLRWSSSLIPVRVPDWVYNQWTKKQFNDVLAFSVYYQF